MRLLSKPGCPYLVAEDLIPLIQDVVDTHPGLTFLQDAPEFHSRYVHTVSTLCLSVPLIQDFVDTHPGLAFLLDAPDTFTLWIVHFLKVFSCLYLCLHRGCPCDRYMDMFQLAHRRPLIITQLFNIIWLQRNILQSRMQDSPQGEHPPYSRNKHTILPIFPKNATKLRTVWCVYQLMCSL